MEVLPRGCDEAPSVRGRLKPYYGGDLESNRRSTYGIMLSSKLQTHQVLGVIYIPISDFETGPSRSFLTGFTYRDGRRERWESRERERGEDMQEMASDRIKPRSLVKALVSVV